MKSRGAYSLTFNIETEVECLGFEGVECCKPSRTETSVQVLSCAGVDVGRSPDQHRKLNLLFKRERGPHSLHAIALRRPRSLSHVPRISPHYPDFNRTVYALRFLPLSLLQSILDIGALRPLSCVFAFWSEGKASFSCCRQASLTVTFEVECVMFATGGALKPS
ncbi:hypothetical protein K439DRAFT_299233 [Ramaria rubella]|nr:hypothetical protein K439DRAFT_299233 [Ramaria rubella]